MTVLQKLQTYFCKDGKIYKQNLSDNFRMFPSDPSGSLDDLCLSQGHGFLRAMPGFLFSNSWRFEWKIL